MLDEIKNSIPKLDENDESRMYENLYNKLNEKKNKRVLKRNILIIVPVFLVSIIIVSCIIIINTINHNTNNSNTNNYNTNNYNTNNYNYFCSNENNIIGMAAFKAFDDESIKSNRNNKSSIFTDNYSILENDNENTTSITTGLDNSDEPKTFNHPSTVKYPYDYIKIKSAIKFTVNVPKIEDYVANQIIDINCGLGDLEVVIAAFTTYVNRDGQLTPDITEQLLCIRGYNGYYTLLSDYYMIDANNLFMVESYTSHKKVTKYAVEKNFDSAVLAISLKREDDDCRYIYFAENFKKDNKYNKDFAFKIDNIIEKVSSEILYSVLELSELPTKTIIVKVKSIDFSTLLIQVESDNDIECVYIYDRISVINNSDLSKIKTGDYIKINYDNLFNGYNPKRVVANEIILIEET